MVSSSILFDLSSRMEAAGITAAAEVGVDVVMLGDWGKSRVAMRRRRGGGGRRRRRREAASAVTSLARSAPFRTSNCKKTTRDVALSSYSYWLVV